MASEINGYQVHIRGVEPAYQSFIARDAGREVDDGNEVTLRELTIDVQARKRDGNNIYRQNYELTYRVGRETAEVALSNISGDATDSRSLGVDHLLAALVRGDRAADEALDHLGADELEFVPVSRQLSEAANADAVELFDYLGEA